MFDVCWSDDGLTCCGGVVRGRGGELVVGEREGLRCEEVVERGREAGEFVGVHRPVLGVEVAHAVEQVCEEGKNE